MNDLFHEFAAEGAFSRKKKLRPHQILAFESIKNSLGKGNKRVVCQGPTGFGKTLIAAKIIRGALDKGNRVIFTAPAITLIDQTVAALEAEGIHDIGVMQSNHPRTDPLARVQVASVATLARRDIPQVDIVIVDECHIRAKVIEELVLAQPDVVFIGLSATPWAKGMGLLWQDLVIPSSIGALIDEGYLSRFSVFAPDVPDMSGVATVKGDYHADQASKVMQGKALMACVVETWLARGGNRPTLLFAVNRAHAKALRAEFEAAGIAAGYCDAWTDCVERRMLERQFRSGEIKVVCSVRTLTTGIDWPVSCIIDAAPTKSEILHVQKIGRGLRINPGTEDLLVLDHAGNSLRLGLVTDIGHDSLDTTQKRKQQTRPKTPKLPSACVKCAVLHTGLFCPVCRHEREPVCRVETIDGDLVKITERHRPATRQEKQAWWSGIKFIQHAKGRSNGWARHTYRDRFQVWPKGIDPTASPEMWNFVKAKDIRFAKRRNG